MNLRSPVVAMLWENWRLSRVEAGQRLVLGLAVASAALVLNADKGATIAMWALITTHAFFWFSIAKLNGGRFMDGYKPGFPLYLLYSRPVSTASFVGTVMAYDAISCTLLYLLSAVLLGLAFGISFPLVPVAVCLVAYHCACTFIQWSTHNRLVQWVGSMVVFWPLIVLLRSGLDSQQTGFSAAQWTLIVFICIASFGLTVIGVARQRRGDAIASEPRKDVLTAYPVWLVGLFRFACPTSSATKAQLWFELKSSGLPVLTIGVALALLILLLAAVGIPLTQFRHGAIAVGMMAVPFVLFLFGSNAFGLRSKQGRSYLSVFEATQPYGNAQMAGIKVLVRTACIVVSLSAIGASIWGSGLLIGAWGEWIVEGGVDASTGILHVRRDIATAIAGQSGYLLAAQGVVACISVGGLVAWLAARESLKVRFPRRALVVIWLPAIWGFSLILLMLSGQHGFLSRAMVGTLIQAQMWLATAVLVLGATYLLWRDIAERSLSSGYVYGSLAILAAFAAAYATLLWAIGEPSAGRAPAAIAFMAWPLLLLLIGLAIAPWSLRRVRHI
jgi:hypothetical protein